MKNIIKFLETDSLMAVLNSCNRLSTGSDLDKYVFIEFDHSDNLREVNSNILQFIERKRDKKVNYINIRGMYKEQLHNYFLFVIYLQHVG